MAGGAGNQRESSGKNLKLNSQRYGSSIVKVQPGGASSGALAGQSPIAISNRQSVSFYNTQ